MYTSCASVKPYWEGHAQTHASHARTIVRVHPRIHTWFSIRLQGSCKCLCTQSVFHLRICIIQEERDMKQIQANSLAIWRLWSSHQSTIAQRHLCNRIIPVFDLAQPKVLCVKHKRLAWIFNVIFFMAIARMESDRSITQESFEDILHVRNLFLPIGVWKWNRIPKTHDFSCFVEITVGCILCRIYRLIIGIYPWGDSFRPGCGGGNINSAQQSNLYHEFLVNCFVEPSLYVLIRTLVWKDPPPPGGRFLRSRCTHVSMYVSVYTRVCVPSKTRWVVFFSHSIDACMHTHTHTHTHTNAHT